MAVFATGGCDRLALGGAKARLFWAMILPSYSIAQFRILAEIPPFEFGHMLNVKWRIKI